MTVGYLNDRIDFAEAIKTFKDAGVTHVAMLTLQDELTKFVTQAHEQNFHPIYIGSDGWGTDRILLDKLMAIPSSIRNFFGFRNTFWDLSRPNLLGKSLIRYLAEKKLSPNWAHAAGFDSMWLVLSGLKAMGYRNDARTLKNELLKLKDLELVSLGKLKWGGDNTPIADIKVFKVELPSQKNSVKK
jgi:ABC-type branched-subunit amino acid transport system substrate-binding protein